MAGARPQQARGLHAGHGLLGGRAAAGFHRPARTGSPTCSSSPPWRGSASPPRTPCPMPCSRMSSNGMNYAQAAGRRASITAYALSSARWRGRLSSLSRFKRWDGRAIRRRPMGSTQFAQPASALTDDPFARHLGSERSCSLGVVVLTAVVPAYARTL